MAAFRFSSIALVTSFLAAVASLHYVIDAGRSSHSILLKTLFTVWVLSPFTGFFIAYHRSANWSYTTRKVLQSFMFFAALMSVIFYSRLVKLPGTYPAFVFLIIPLLSLILLAAVILIGRIGKNN